MKFTIIRYDTIGSTNDEAMRQAKLGAAEGLCVIARQQTAGRGRHGRVWASPPDAGLYCSFVLRPTIEMRQLPLITLAAGVAVHEALAECGLSPDIKWVNDVLVSERKISGILAESAETGQGLAVVVGIGINLRASGIPPELSETATSIETELGRAVDAEKIFELLASAFDRYYELLIESPQTIVQEWARRSSYYEGKAVTVTSGADTITGSTAGLEDNGALRLKTGDGAVTIVQAGDVRRLRPAG